MGSEPSFLVGFDTSARKLKTEVRKLAGRWLKDVERRLEGREWIACADFTVADIMMACVLRGIRNGFDGTVSEAQGVL
jgi:glutathione S-transferase